MKIDQTNKQEHTDENFCWAGSLLPLANSGNDLWIKEEMEKVSYPEGDARLYSSLEENSFWFLHRNDCITEIVARFPPPGEIWDMGGGNGWVALALSRAGYTTFVVEPGLDGAMKARSRGLKPVFCCEFEDLRLPPGSISAVSLFDVVEHLAEPETVLQTVREKLKPGGMVYLTVPAYSWLWSDEDVSVGHYRRYTVETIKALLTQTGFETMYHTHFFGYLILPVWLGRRLPHLLGNNRQGQARDEHITNAHKKRNQLISNFLSRLNRRELAVIRRARMTHGTSIMIVGRKPG